jgi:protein-L-isoaspartate(D-aspartate) O-methyltransferase
MTDQDFSTLRAAMVSNQLRTNAVTDPDIVAALEAVAREDFVPTERAALAYVDVPVPLGNGRSLNSPLATARLLVESGVKAGDKVLLIGAATGYCAALLAQLGVSVVAVEEDAGLADRASKALAGEASVKLVKGELAAGYAKSAPYDAIIIDGAVEQLPASLCDQLKEGGTVATALQEGAVGRLATGRKAGGQVALIPFLDCEASPLPGFEKPRSFSFQV